MSSSDSCTIFSDCFSIIFIVKIILIKIININLIYLN